MKKYVCFAAAAVLAGQLVGCGGSGEFEAQTGQPLQSRPSFSGKVTSSDGAALSGVTVIAQDRTTTREVKVVSGSDGSFALMLPPGVYDLGLDKKGDSSLATAYYGPIAPGASEERSFVLPATAGHEPGQIFGKILNQTGAPAVGLPVAVRPGAVNDRVALESVTPPSVVTGARGEFALTLGTAAGAAVDVEVSDASNQQQEFIDIAKRGKACYVEFALDQSPVKNVYRCNESPGPEPDLDSTTGPVLFKGGLVPVVDPPSFPIKPFQTSFFSTGKGEANMENGGIAPGTSAPSLKSIGSDPPQEDDFSFRDLANVYQTTGIRVNNYGSWGDPYSIEVNPNLATNWTFTEASGTQHTLGVFLADNKTWHRVSYDSFEPGIVAIEFDL